jgi:sigma-54 dependent transcriptional regulator, acetoin dehydrogenase operon transcriptional activator AcoR
MTKEHEIRTAWEGFVENGTVPVTLREVVLASWQRSHDHGVSLERKGAPLALEAELVKGSIL